MANQKISPTQMVGASEKRIFPHTDVGTESEYRARLPVACECNDRNQHEDADERDRHHDAGGASVHRAFVRIPTTPVMMR